MMIQGQGSRAKGQSVMEESGESSKGKTPFPTKTPNTSTAAED